jgi:hypothetical protein
MSSALRPSIVEPLQSWHAPTRAPSALEAGGMPRQADRPRPRWYGADVPMWLILPSPTVGRCPAPAARALASSPRSAAAGKTSMTATCGHALPRDALLDRAVAFAPRRPVVAGLGPRRAPRGPNGTQGVRPAVAVGQGAPPALMGQWVQRPRAAPGPSVRSRPRLGAPVQRVAPQDRQAPSPRSASLGRPDRCRRSPW